MNPFHGHENSDFGFHGAKLSHEISMKFFTSSFHEPWKVYKAMNMDFHGSWKSNNYTLDRHISWPLKGSYSLACISWLMKGLMAHEIPMKAQLKTHKMCPTHTSTKVDINGPEKCCTHLSIRNIKILPNLFKLRSIKFMMTHTNAKKNCVIKNSVTF